MADSDSCNGEQSSKMLNMNEGGSGNINQALLNLMDQTGYSMLQENGQRKYGGPPPGWEGPAPLKGCEVFVGKIPRDCFEDELVPIFGNIGKIYEMRLMMDFSGSNRGYAFVMFTSTEDAKRAIQQLNNFQIRQGKYIGVVKSVDNCRLFVGGIPKTKTKEEIREEMAKVTEGVVDVILYNAPRDKAKNRGFAFIEYESHRAAAIARRKLIPGRVQLWGQTIMVDWAEPEPEVDEDIMARVKVLYVRNLMESTSEETIRERFEAKKPGGVEKVKKLRDFAFVHFTTRELAEEAMQDLNETDLDGSKIEVTWAKPPDRSNGKNYNRGPHQSNSMSTYPYNLTYGMNDMQLNYNAMAAPAIVSAPVSGRGSYGMRSPLRGRGRGAAGLRGGRGFYSGGSRYPEYRFYDFHPGLHIVPTNQIPIRQTKLPIQALIEFCQKNNLGEPSYSLISIMRQQGPSNTAEPLFAYKVFIQNWGTHNPNASQFCRNPDEAKHVAAQYTLMELEGYDGCDIPATYYGYPPNAYPIPAATTHY